MQTPIYDFIQKYQKNDISRLHMPGHKGKGTLGFESMDITEIMGADSLYHADGIISQSEDNATKLFGSGRTLYSTEGSTHCIKSMVALARTWAMLGRAHDNSTENKIVALRNIHKSFVNACALLDIDVVWIFPENGNNSICECNVSMEEIERVVSTTDAFALYITSPDYLGNIADIGKIADICHRYGKLLLVDNAHGAYLKFLEESRHPIDMGADICCDSAHKTLPVLTGGAYLHISKRVGELIDYGKDMMSVFGSTSPSYLTMQSLDLCNRYLQEEFREQLRETVGKVGRLKSFLIDRGFYLIGNEPLKIAVFVQESTMSGDEMAQQLREHGVECEFSDRNVLVLMFATANTSKDYERVREAFATVERSMSVTTVDTKLSVHKRGIDGEKQPYEKESEDVFPQRVMSIRQAFLSPQKKVNIHDATGLVCGMSVVSCPPAIPIIVSGERIDENMVSKLEYNKIDKINVVI